MALSHGIGLLALSHSLTSAAVIGSATCYQIVAHKNVYTYPRDVFCTQKGGKTFLRS